MLAVAGSNPALRKLFFSFDGKEMDSGKGCHVAKRREELFHVEAGSLEIEREADDDEWR